MDSFDIVVTDEFGGTSSQSLEVNLAALPFAGMRRRERQLAWTQRRSAFLRHRLPLAFRDADLDYDPTRRSLTLMVNNNTVIGGEGKIDVMGPVRNALTIKADGSLHSYTVASTFLGQGFAGETSPTQSRTTPATAFPPTSTSG